MPVGPGDAQRRHEMRAPPFGRLGAFFHQLGLDFVHREPEILVRAGPARGMNSRLAAERIDRQAGIVGEGGQAGGLGRGLRLDPRVGAEAGAGFLGLRELELARRHRVDAERREQVAHLGELARIVRGDDQAAGDEAVCKGPSWPGYVPAISLRGQIVPKRDARHKAGHDGVRARFQLTSPPSFAGRPACRCPCAPARARRGTAPRRTASSRPSPGFR